MCAELHIYIHAFIQESSTPFIICHHQNSERKLHNKQQINVLYNKWAHFITYYHVRLSCLLDSFVTTTTSNGVRIFSKHVEKGLNIMKRIKSKVQLKKVLFFVKCHLMEVTFFLVYNFVSCCVCMGGCVRYIF